MIHRTLRPKEWFGVEKRIFTICGSKNFFRATVTAASCGNRSRFSESASRVSDLFCHTFSKMVIRSQAAPVNLSCNKKSPLRTSKPLLSSKRLRDFPQDFSFRVSACRTHLLVSGEVLSRRG
jgi:hypothetical protein